VLLETGFYRSNLGPKVRRTLGMAPASAFLLSATTSILPCYGLSLGIWKKPDWYRLLGLTGLAQTFTQW